MRAAMPGESNLKNGTITHPNYRCIVLISAAMMLISIIPQFITWAPDDIYMATLSNPNQFAQRAYMLASRPLGAVLFWILAGIHLNIIRDYYIFSVIYAISFAWFFLSAVSWLTNSGPRLLTAAAGAALVCFHGFQVDFSQFKHQYIVVSLMYLLMGIYLRVLAGMRHRGIRFLLLVVVGLLVNLCYQAGTMALAMLLAGRLLVLTVEARSFAQAAWDDWSRILDAFISILISCLAYYAVTRMMYVLDIPTLRPPVHLNFQWISQRLHIYFSAIWALLVPAGGPYGSQNDFGFIMWSLAAVPLLIRTYAARQLGRFLLATGLILLIAVLAQNPENIFLPNYWPAPRASFYASFVTPILLVAAFSSCERQTSLDIFARKFLGWVTLFAVLLEVSATSHIIIDHIKVYGRDMALAREISQKIAENPDLSRLSQIRFPAASWDPRQSYFLGLEPPAYDYGSLFAAPWSANALIEMASGLKLTVSGASVCPAGPRTISTLAVRREADYIAVCF